MKSKLMKNIKIFSLAWITFLLTVFPFVKATYGHDLAQPASVGTYLISQRESVYAHDNRAVAARTLSGRWVCDIVNGGVMDITYSPQEVTFIMRQFSPYSQNNSPGEVIGEFTFAGMGDTDFIGRHLWGGSKTRSAEWGAFGGMIVRVVDAQTIHVRYTDSVYTDGWIYKKMHY